MIHHWLMAAFSDISSDLAIRVILYVCWLGVVFALVFLMVAMANTVVYNG